MVDQSTDTTGIDQTTTFRKEKQLKLLEELRCNPTVQAACLATGVSRATYYRWLQNDPQFKTLAFQALQDAVFDLNAQAEQWLVDRVREGEKSATYFWLKHRHEAYKR